MRVKLKDWFNEWAMLFPFEAFILDDDSRIAMANELAQKSFNINSKIHKYFDHYLEYEFLSTFLAFKSKLQSNSYMAQNMAFKALGDFNVLGRKLESESGYFLILLFPEHSNEQKNKYLNLKQKYDVLMKFVSDSVIVTDENQKILEANESFASITGYSYEEVRGKFPTILSSGKHDKEFYKDMFVQMGQNGYFHGDLTDRRKSGEIMQVEATIVPLKNSANLITNYVGILKDVTEVKTLRKNIQASKNKDSLTGVQNRESFLYILEIKCELSSHENPLALLFIDLNKFKHVNDTYGHKYGDFVLSSAANRMKNILRTSDIIGRFGGDEFLILLERVDKESAQSIAEKLAKELAKPYVVDEQVIDFVSGSIGIAFAPTDSTRALELIEKADAAMYRAKKSVGVDRIVSSSDIDSERHQNKTFKSELLNAIENNEFYLRIQPIVSVHNGKIIGGETLSRWFNLYFNEVMPGTFIPLIETLGMEKKFDMHILNKSIELLEAQPALPEGFFLDVNFSAEQFNDVKFIQKLQELLDLKPWIKDYIVIEITESTLMVNIERTSQYLSAIKDLGFKIAIDDFGTGFSSLSYLKYFDIDYLKIDISFVKNIEENPKDREIIKTISVLANAIGAKTIIEGVERQSQYDIIKELDIDYIQGYYFYKPLVQESYFSMLLN